MRNSIVLLCVFFLGCQSDKKWAFDKKIMLPEETRPLGMALVDEGLWVSDPDNNQVLRIDESGSVLETISNLFRPMHIEANHNKLFIPNFSNDTISVYANGKSESLFVEAEFDAPSGLSVQEGLIAFADFYNHRVLLSKNGDVTQIGAEGRTDGLLFYPTDLKIYGDKIVVADAYNNRVQIFSLDGAFVKVIGWQEEIRVATGLDVFEDLIYVSDYYGNRVLIYDLEGTLINILEGQFNKPTDVLVHSDKMYVANYGENSISIFEIL